MKKALLSALLLSASFYLVAQESPIPARYQNPVPPTPNVATLGKFGDVPVSKYTGVPDITIPLLRIQVKDFTLPITANYHPAGVQVADEASFLGLGWALNAGGVISQIVSDRNDFEGFGYYYIDQPDAAVSGLNFESSRDYISNYVCTGEMDYQSIVSFSSRAHGQLLPSGCQLVLQDDYFFQSRYDTEPDIFFFNFAGYSGKFLWDKRGHKFQIMDRQNIDIQFEGAETGWVLTTPDGNKFYFEAIEKTNVNSYSPIINGQNSVNSSTGPDFNSFFLSKIVLVEGDEILFQYTDGDRICNLPRRNQQFTLITNTGSCPSGNTVSVSESSVVPKYLQYIRFPGSYVEFKWDTRMDVRNGRRLTRINQISSQTGALIRYSEFDNDQYFQGHTSWNSQTSSAGNAYCEPETISNDRLYKRLRLNSIFVSDYSKPYTFLYNETRTLPSKMSYAQDYWGYYNGNDDAKSLYPDPLKHYERIDKLFIENQTVYNDYQDRSPNDYSKTWVISSVKYPTAGTTEFEFENNTYRNYENDNYGRSRANAYSSIYVSDTYSSDANQVNYFSLDRNQAVKITASFPGNRDLNTDLYTHNAYGRIINTATGQVTWQFQYLTYPQNYSTTCQNPTATYQFDLPAGQYKLIVEKDANNKVCNPAGGTYYSVQVDYLAAPANPSVKFLKGPGLRVKRMLTKDDFGGTQEKMFKYEYGQTIDGVAIQSSYGQIMNSPLFFRKYTKYDAYSISCAMFEVQGTAYNSLSKSAKGSYIGYDRVIEVVGNDADNIGRVETLFINQTDICMAENSGPCVSTLSNGAMLSELTFDRSGTLVKSDSLTYRSLQDMFKSYGIKSYDVSSSPEDVFDKYIAVLHFYPIHCYRTDLMGKKTTLYSGGLAFRQESVMDYYANGLKKSETVTNSDGTVKMSTFKYPQNYTMEPYPTMVGVKNWIQPVVEISTQTGSGELVYQQSNNYARFSDGDILLSDISNTFPLGTKEEIFRVLEYDPFNNPISTVEKDGLLKAYAYDARGVNLLSFGLNCKPSDIFYEGFEAGNGTSTEGDCKAGARSQLNGYNKVVSGLTPGRYVLSYFYKNSKGEWEPSRESISIAGTSYTIALSGQLDEVRLYPSEAQLTTFTYKDGVGMTSATDSNDQTTYYEYDQHNRLLLTRDNERNIVRKFGYHHKD